jgi:hypothetical protein
MIETLRQMDRVMPLEIWGIALGLVGFTVLFISFLCVSDWLSDRKMFKNKTI